MIKNGRPVTKSVRLRADESELIAEVSAREHLTEDMLLRKWVLDALAHARLEYAIADYAAGEINLGEAAGRASVSVIRMLAEMDGRGIDTITPAHFRASLTNLTELFGSSEELRAVIQERADEM
jgi:hypothetical protein